jgi:hypothetical protein
MMARGRWFEFEKHPQSGAARTRRKNRREASRGRTEPSGAVESTIALETETGSKEIHLLRLGGSFRNVFKRK